MFLGVKSESFLWIFCIHLKNEYEMKNYVNLLGINFETL